MIPANEARRPPEPTPLQTGAVTGTPSAALARVYEQGHALEREGLTEEARQVYEGALRDGTAATAVDAAQLLRLVSRTHLDDANFDAARDCALSALAVAEQHGDLIGQGHAVNNLAVIEWRQGRVDEAASLYQQALAISRRAGDARLSVMIAANLGVIANVRGDEQGAREAYESSLAAARTAGLAEQVIAALGNLGQLHTQAGRLDDAERYLAEARELSEVMGGRAVLVTAELLIARLRIRQGDHDGARAACERARALLAQIGDGREAGEMEQVQGLVARASGDDLAAERHFVRAEDIAIRRRDVLLQGEAARELGDLYRTQGRNRHALQRLNQAHRIFAQLRARRELADVDRRTASLENDFLDVVSRWSDSIESKDVYTRGHCERVADLACALWTRVSREETSLFWFRIGALLHDVGKLMVPAEVLNKPGKLTEEEWALVRAHPTAGVALLADIEFPWDVRPIVESHHERWDGHGYPHGLAGEDIPLTARVLCVADVYDALTSQRSYKRAFTHDEAMRLMRQESGAQFDPALFAEFEELMRSWRTGGDEGRHLVLVR